MNRKDDASLTFWQCARDFAFWAERATGDDAKAHDLARKHCTRLVNAAEHWYQTPSGPSPRNLERTR